MDTDTTATPEEIEAAELAMLTEAIAEAKALSAEVARLNAAMDIAIAARDGANA